MRGQGGGRIINVSAMGSHFSLPGTGVLHASKHAVRAVSDAMRMELRAFGISVSAVEPGAISTAFSGKANASLPAVNGTGVYDRFHSDMAAYLDAAYQKKLTVLSADAVARVIEHAARTTRPKAHCPVGVMSRGLITLKRLLPDAAFDAIIRSQFPTPKLRPVRRPGDLTGNRAVPRAEISHLGAAQGMVSGEPASVLLHGRGELHWTDGRPVLHCENGNGVLPSLSALPLSAMRKYHNCG